MRTSTLTPRPVRLDTTKAIVGYTHFLMMKGQMAGCMMIDGHRPGREEAEIEKRFQELSSRLALRLAACKEGEIADILECYDTAFRLGYRRMPDTDIVSRQKRRILQAWTAKARDVEDSSVFSLIAADVKIPHTKADTSYTSAYKKILKDWVGTLLAHNTFPATSAYEKYQRLAMIMAENIDPLTGGRGEQLKKTWYLNNRVADLSTLSSQILRSYRRFVSSLPPTVIGFDEKIALDTRILRELSSRRDLDPYDSEAFRMALQFNIDMFQC